MFPGDTFRVEIALRAQGNKDGEIKWLEKSALILQLSRGLDGFYTAPTLGEAMAQVRSWKAAQDAAGER